MNKRLREFEKESGLEIYGLGARREIWERALEKYAELIVLDCIEVCKSRVGNSDYNTGRLHCVSDIRERFGLDGMTTEDKKTLIKELLGVKND